MKSHLTQRIRKTPFPADLRHPNPRVCKSPPIQAHRAAYPLRYPRLDDSGDRSGRVFTKFVSTIPKIAKLWQKVRHPSLHSERNVIVSTGCRRPTPSRFEPRQHTAFAIRIPGRPIPLASRTPPGSSRATNHFESIAIKRLKI